MAYFPAYPSCKERTNFAKLCRAIIDLGADGLRDVLFVLVKPAQLKSKVRYLKVDPQQIVQINNAVVKGNYSDFDISLLCKLLRHVWPSNDPNYPPPAKAWGGPCLPDAMCISYGDDIERIRILRNTVYGHIANTYINDTEFNDSWKLLKDVMNRFDSRLKVKRYEKDLDDIESMCMDSESEKMYIDRLEKLAVFDREQIADIHYRLTDIENKDKETEEKLLKQKTDIENYQTENRVSITEVQKENQDKFQQLKKEQVQLKEEHKQFKEEQVHLKDEQEEIKQKHLQHKDEQEEIKEGQLQLKDEQEEIKEGQLQLKDEQEEIKEGQLQLKDEQEEIKEGQLQLKDEQEEIKEGQLQLKDEQEEIKEELLQLKDEHKEIKGEQIQLKDEQQQIKGEQQELKEEQVQLEVQHKEIKEEQIQLKDEQQQIKGEQKQIKVEHIQIKDEQLQLKTGENVMQKHVEKLKKSTQSSRRRHKILSRRVNKIENEYIFRETEKKTERIKYTRSKIRKILEESGSKFVKTRAFTKLLQNIKLHGCALVIGNPGDGKTTLATFCMQELLAQKDKILNPIQIHDPAEWNTFIGRNVIIFIDNMFGLYSPSENEPQKWKGMLENMISSTDISNENRNFLLVTVTKEVYQKCPSSIKKLFDENVVIDLNSDYRLSEEEIKCMINAYTPEGFRFEKKHLKEIIDNKIPLGLPQTCALFHKSFHDQGVEFFKRPIDYFKTEIDTRSEEGKNTYAILVLIFLIGRPLHRDDLSDFSVDQYMKQTINQVSNMCSLSLTERTGTSYQETARSLIGLFLRYDESTHCYSFIHNSIQDAVGLQLYDNYPAECIELSSVHLFEKMHSYSHSLSPTFNSIPIYRENFLDVATKVFLHNKEVQNLSIIASSQIWEDDDFNETFKQSFQERQKSSSEAQLDKSFISVAAEVGNINLVKTLVSLNIYAPSDYKCALDGAARHGQERVALYLLNMAISPTSETLFESIRGGCLALFERILEFNLQDNLSIKTRTSKSKLFNIGGTTVLHEACELGKTEFVKNILRRFPDLINCIDDIGCNACHSAACNGSVDILRLLIETKKGYNCGSERNFDGCSILHQVCCSGNTKAMEYLRNIYPDIINKRNNNGEGILHWVALHGTFEMFEYIIKNNNEKLVELDISSKNIYGATILHFACQAGNIRIVKYFAKCFPALLNEVDNNGDTVLHYACRGNKWDRANHVKFGRDEETVKYLVNAGIGINTLTHERQSILHVACLSQNEDLFKFLYSKYPETLLAKNDGHQWNLLHYSAHNRNLEFIKYLQGIEIDIRDKTDKNETLLHLAAFYGNVELCRYLITEYKYMLDMENVDGSSALHYAGEGGSVEVVELLIKNEVDIMQENDREETVLHLACLQGHLVLCRHLISYNSDLLNCKNIDCLSVLHYACQGESIELIEFLIQTGVDVYEKTDLNETVLHMALLNNREQICNFLTTRYRGLLNVKAKRGWNVLHYAVEGGGKACIDLLCANNVDVFEKTEDNETVLHLASLCGNINICKYLLKTYPDLIKLRTKNEWTVLHCACQGGNISLIKYLITDKHTNVLERTSRSQSCLHIASYHRHTAVSEYLLKHSPNVLKYKDVSQWTALHSACQGGDIETVKLLMEYGLQVDEETDNNASGIHIACLSGNLPVCEYILELFPEMLFLKDNKKCNILHYAAKSGSVSLVRYLLAVIEERGTHDISILHVTIEGENVLHIACEYNHLDLCKYLISSYSQLSTMEATNGSNVLHYAAKGGNLQIIKILLESKVGLDKGIHKVNDFRQLILHLSALHNNVEMCNFLIQNYPELPKYEDVNKWAFRHYCIYGGSDEIMDFEAKIESKKLTKTSILIRSCFVNDIKTCKILLKEHPNIIFERPTNYWTLHQATSDKSKVYIETLIVEKSMGVSDSEEVLLRIVHAKSKQTILDALQKDDLFKLANNPVNDDTFFPFKKEIDGRDTAYVYIFHMREINKEPDLAFKVLQSACLQQKYKICKYFLERYPNLLYNVDHNGTSVLMYACRVDFIDMVKFLVEKGADVDLVNDYAENCLHIAVRYGCIRVVKYLVNEHPHLKNDKINNGANALHLAMQSSFILFETLISSGMNAYETDGRGRTILHLSCLSSRKQICYHILENYPDMIRIQTHLDASALHVASVGGDVELLCRLLNYKHLNPFGKDKFGNTILHVSCIYPRQYELTECIDPLSDGSRSDVKEIITRETKMKVIKFLVNTFPDLLPMRNDAGKTVLHYAATTDLEFVKFFTAKKLDVFDTCKLGENILCMAISYDKTDIVLYLMNNYPRLVKVVTKGNKTPLHYARERKQKEVLQRLIECYYSNQMRYLSGIYQCAFEIPQILTRGKDDSMMDFKQGVSEFQRVLVERDITLFEYLTEIDPELSKTDESGRNVLHLAVINEDEEICKFVLQDNRYKRHLVNAKDNDGHTALQMAAIRGCKLDIFKTLISADIGVHDGESDSRTMLHLAMLKKQRHICNYILQTYPDLINVSEEENWSILHSASHFGDVAILTELCKCNADLDPYVTKSNGDSILHVACLYPEVSNVTIYFDSSTHDQILLENMRQTKTKVINHLINTFPDLLTMRNNRGKTAFHYAAESDFEFVKIFLNQNSGVFEPDNDGWNILHVAVCMDQKDTVEYLINTYPELIKVKTKENKTALQYARERNHTELLQMLVGCYYKNQIRYLLRIYQADFEIRERGVSTIQMVLAKRDIALFEYLTEVDPDLRKTDESGRSVLHLAVINEDEEICKRVIQNSHYKRYLMNAKDKDGHTALHIAAIRGCKLDIFKTLLSANIGVSDGENNGRTILHLAILNNHRDICNCILETYTELINISDKENWSVQHYASHCGDVALLAKLYKCKLDLNPYVKNSKGDSILHVACLYPKLPNVTTSTDSTTNDPISNEDKRQTKEEVIGHLIQKFPDLLVMRNNGGRTALHYAAESEFNFVKMFLNKKLNIYDTDSDGWNVLHIAVYNGKKEIAQALLDRYPGLEAIKTKENKTAIQYAREKNEEELFQMLVEYHFSNQITYLKRIYPDNFQIPQTLHKETVSKFQKALTAQRDMTVFQYVLEIDPDLKKTNNGRSILHFAVMHEDVEMCKCVVQHDRYKSLLNMKDVNGSTPIDVAIESNNLIILKILLCGNKKSYRNFTNTKNLLHLAVLRKRPDICQSLLKEHGYVLREKDNKGKTPLHVASQFGDLETFKLLEKHNADMHNLTNENQTVLHLATKQENIPICEYILINYPSLLYSQDSNGNTPIQYAIGNRHLRRVLFVGEWFAFIGIAFLSVVFLRLLIFFSRKLEN